MSVHGHINFSVFAAEIFQPSDLLTELIDDPRFQVRSTIEDCLLKNFLEPQEITHTIAYQVYHPLRQILTLLEGQIEGKKFLDLGCGSMGGVIDSDDDPTGEDFIRWQPWLCRVLQKLGAHVIGIDIGEAGQEDFEVHQLNLLEAEKGILDFIPDHSVDLVHSRQLFSSPHL